MLWILNPFKNNLSIYLLYVSNVSLIFFLNALGQGTEISEIKCQVYLQLWIIILRMHFSHLNSKRTNTFWTEYGCNLTQRFYFQIPSSTIPPFEMSRLIKMTRVKTDKKSEFLKGLKDGDISEHRNFNKLEVSEVTDFYFKCNNLYIFNSQAFI